MRGLEDDREIILLVREHGVVLDAVADARHEVLAAGLDRRELRQRKRVDPLEAETAEGVAKGLGHGDPPLAVDPVEMRAHQEGHAGPHRSLDLAARAAGPAGPPRPVPPSVPSDAKRSASLRPPTDSQMGMSGISWDNLGVNGTLVYGELTNPFRIMTLCAWLDLCSRPGAGVAGVHCWSGMGRQFGRRWRRRSARAGRRQTACKPGSVPAGWAGDGHSSGTSVAGRLARPTRAAARKPACRRLAGMPPLLGLAPGGVYHAVPVAGDAVRSYRTLSPLPGDRGPRRRFAFCGTIPGVAPAGRYPAPCFRGARTFLPRRP